MLPEDVFIPLKGGDSLSPHPSPIAAGKSLDSGLLADWQTGTGSNSGSALSEDWYLYRYLAQVEQFAPASGFSELTISSPSLTNTSNSDKDPLTGDRLSTNTSEIVFIDGTVPDYQNLIDGVTQGAKVVLLDSTRDGVEQIGEVLAQSTDISSIHIVSHGDSGSLQLGNAQLNLQNIETQYGASLQKWAGALTDKADILVYGCDVASGEQGAAFVQQLGELTEADVAASDDRTGSSDLGGDWELEVKTGEIETGEAFAEEAIASYHGILPTNRISVASDGTQADKASSAPAISADGRFVAFRSNATNLIGGDSNGVADIFVRDSQTGEIKRVSVATGGGQANGFSDTPNISADGRFVAFRSNASNLVSDDTNNKTDVFVHDTQTGETKRVSLAGDGKEGNGASTNPSISADGRFVAFQSFAKNLVSKDTNGTADVFVKDLQTGEVKRVSVASNGTQGNNPSNTPSISADGNYVTFVSLANNLVSGDSNAVGDIFVYNRQTGETKRVSVASDGTQADNPSPPASSSSPSISGDGKYVVFRSAAKNLVNGDTNGVADIFLHNTQTGETKRISVATGGTQADGESYTPSISADGRYVVFQSDATNLVTGDTNLSTDIFAYDIQTGETKRISLATNGIEGNKDSYTPAISGNGNSIAFISNSNNFVTGDKNQVGDIFVNSNNNNNAPVLDNTGNQKFTAITEDVAVGSNSGNLISEIIASGANADSITDLDAGALEGIAVTYADSNNGTWQYSLNGGTNWTDFASLGLDKGLLLASDDKTKIRFQPKENFSGTSEINFYAWDRTSGSNGGTANLLPAILGGEGTGGNSAFSTAYEGASITVNPVNDTAPTLTSATPTLPEITQDSPLDTNIGTSVADLVSGLISDSDKDPQGIAITGLDNTNGKWQYSLNGGTNWSDFGAVSDNSATVLSAGVSLYKGASSSLPSQQGWLQFGNVPVPLPGAGSQTLSGGSTKLVSTALGTTGYSNHNTYTPVLFNQLFPTLDAANGYTVSFDLKVNSESHNNNDRAGFNLIAVSSDKTKAIELGFWNNEVWAQNANPLFTHSTTETAAVDTTALTRYDLNIKGDTYNLFAAGASTPILSGSLKDYSAFDHTTAVPSPINSLPYDPYETPNFLFFGDNTTAAQADVNLANVELKTNSRIRFVPNADFNGTANVSFRAWDGSNNVASGATGVDASSNGGTTAFSSTSNTASVTVTGANDTTPPTASLTATEITAGGGETYEFTVTYTDDLALNVGNLDDLDVRVTGPNGFDRLATFVGVDTLENGTPRTATYRIGAPGGTWDLADNGTYSVLMEANQVKDTSDNPVAAGELGTFAVNVSEVSSNAPILDLNGSGSGINYSANFTSGGAVAIADSANLSITDVDSNNIMGAKVTIANLQNGANEVLAVSNSLASSFGITSNYSEGVLTLSGTATNAQYEQLLRTATYNNTASSPNTSDRTINFLVNDGTADSIEAITTLTFSNSNTSPTIPLGNMTAGMRSRPSVASLSDANPEDLYEFSVSNSTRVVAHLALNGGNANLELLDSNLSVLNSSTQAGSLSENLDYTGLIPGTYSFRVRQASAGESLSYKLSLNFA